MDGNEVRAGEDCPGCTITDRIHEYGCGLGPMTGEECEHGLDAGLCMGPSHYPTSAQEAAGILYPSDLA